MGAGGGGKECKENLKIQFNMVVLYTTHRQLFSLFIQSNSPFLIGSHSTANSLKTFVAINFLSHIMFLFLLFSGMVMYANKVETKEK